MLQLIREDFPAPQVSIRVESPVPGVVLIDAALDRDDAPLHWRAGLWNKPPLDISLHHDGRLAGIQFVLQDEKVPDTNAVPAVGGSKGGWPVFDVASWPADRYLDEEVVVSFARSSDILVLRFGSEPARRWVGNGRGLAFGLGDRAAVGIALGPLDAGHWNVIDAFSTAT